jgi:hypothetical protein
MKTKKIISMKALTAAMFAIALFIFAGCNEQQKNTAKENEQSTVSEKTVKPPSTDIHTAVFMGNLAAVNQHIKAGSNLNEKDKYGSSPLMIAVTFEKNEIAKALIEGGADINLTNNDKSTPLHTAAFLCRVDIVKMLLDKGADKNLRNKFGSTALEAVSASFDDVKVVYDKFGKELGPLGLKLDYEYLKITRPKIAKMLQ